MVRCALATILVFLLAGIPLPARPAGTPNLLPLGVVTQASGAHFRAAKVSAGATIYDGDGLSTEAEGALQFRGSAAMYYLPGSSGVTLHGSRWEPRRSFRPARWSSPQPRLSPWKSLRMEPSFARLPMVPRSPKSALSALRNCRSERGAAPYNLPMRGKRRK